MLDYIVKPVAVLSAYLILNSCAIVPTKVKGHHTEKDIPVPGQFKFKANAYMVKERKLSWKSFPEADSNRDGVVSTDELKKYIREKVMRPFQ